jgi:hypothetical protein
MVADSRLPQQIFINSRKFSVRGSTFSVTVWQKVLNSGRKASMGAMCFTPASFHLQEKVIS